MMTTAIDDPTKLAELEAQLTAEQARRELLVRGPTDLEFFCKHALKIRPKVGQPRAVRLECRAAQAARDPRGAESEDRPGARDHP